MVINNSWRDSDDIYERYEKLRVSEEIYRTAMSLTSHIISVVDIPNRITYQVHNEGEWSTLTSAMENVPESIIDTGIIHPDDVEAFRQYYRDMFAGIRDTGCVIRSKDDKRGWLWFNVISRTVYDDEGNPLRAIVFSDDITDIKNAEAHYEQYKKMVTTDAEFVWEVNLTRDTVLSWDSSFDAAFKQSIDQTYTELHTIASDCISNEEQRRYIIDNFNRDALLKAFSENKSEVTADYLMDIPGGAGSKWMSLVCHFILNIKGEVQAIMAVKDVSAVYDNLKELEKMAEQDALTGLYNRYALKKRIEKINTALPDAVNGFIIFDLDEFKKCNDTYGHTYGDEILSITADTMRKTFRDSDVLCRLGGDEYLIFMTNVKDKYVVSEKANKLIENLKEVSRTKSLKFPINISAGGTISKPGERYEDIYSRIDDGLYISKRNGKSRFTFM